MERHDLGKVGFAFAILGSVGIRKKTVVIRFAVERGIQINQVNTGVGKILHHLQTIPVIQRVGLQWIAHGFFFTSITGFPDSVQYIKRPVRSLSYSFIVIRSLAVT